VPWKIKECFKVDDEDKNGNCKKHEGVNCREKEESKERNVELNREHQRDSTRIYIKNKGKIGSVGQFLKG